MKSGMPAAAVDIPPGCRRRALVRDGAASGRPRSGWHDRSGPISDGGRQPDLSREARDIAERAHTLRFGLVRSLHVLCNEALGLPTHETLQLLFGPLQFLAKNLDAVVITSGLLERGDDLRRDGPNLREEGARVRHQASESKEGKPGRKSAFIGPTPALNIDCLHGTQCPPLPVCVSTIVFDSCFATSGAAKFRERGCTAVVPGALRKQSLWDDPGLSRRA